MDKMVRTTAAIGYPFKGVVSEVSGDMTARSQAIGVLPRSTGSLWSPVETSAEDVARYEKMRDEFFFDLY